LTNEYALIRSGRINLNIFNDIRVEAYGEQTPINQVATLQLVDARQVIIKPFDKGVIKDLMTALNASNIGAAPQLNSDTIRIIFPPITEETRKANVKRAKELLENTKVRVRNVRQAVQTKYKKNTGISEDTLHYFEDELNKITKEYNNKLETIFSTKESELLKF
jgi:ribosome recycling factor